MKARPILFNGAMVRAILADNKTVTRRAIKHQPDVPVTDAIARRECPHGPATANWYWRPKHGHLNGMPSHGWDFQCPYGQVGDRLWVRETFMDLLGTGVEHRPDPSGPLQRYAYATECPPGSYADEARKDMGLKWKPSIHMPRAACRLELEIVAVRVERLQVISRADIRAEGLVCPPELASDDVSPNYRDWYPAAFRELWESTGGDWVGNPWVWVVEFRRVLPEAMAATVAA
ncbi:hypothetical protein [Pseudomonas sp. PARCl1]|uniref:hypothetical protein n=1 Tax=Pseudomonas sp. PARCl1 TaxID=2853444 RepID=UPI001C776DE0|nr:hypothetical protein [Pseudomonas sp. PARCl1]QXM18694.1 hypothetical protein [Pseudomonas phage PARCL1pr]